MCLTRLDIEPGSLVIAYNVVVIHFFLAYDRSYSTSYKYHINSSFSALGNYQTGFWPSEHYYLF